MIVVELFLSDVPKVSHSSLPQVCAEVAMGGYGRKGVVVRINSLDSPWGEDDIREVAKLTLDAVVLPKVRVQHFRTTILARGVRLQREFSVKTRPDQCRRDRGITLIGADFLQQRPGWG